MPIQGNTTEKNKRTLRQAIELVTKLRLLAGAQLGAIQGKEWETVEAILRQKQTLIDDLLTLKQHQEYWDKQIGHGEQDLSQDIQDLRSSFNEGIEGLVGAELAAMAVLQENRESIRKELSVITRGQQVSKRYDSQSPGKPKLDMHG